MSEHKTAVVEMAASVSSAATKTTYAGAGCQSNSVKPTNVCPVLPIKPSLSTPLPTVSYSKLAQQNIEQWQKKQMATQLMSND